MVITAMPCGCEATNCVSQTRARLMKLSLKIQDNDKVRTAPANKTQLTRTHSLMSFRLDPFLKPFETEGRKKISTGFAARNREKTATTLGFQNIAGVTHQRSRIQSIELI